MNVNQRTGRPYVRERLYGARLVNSPYLYEDPYTTIAEDDIGYNGFAGSASKADRIARRAARREKRKVRKTARKTKRSDRKARRNSPSVSRSVPSASASPFSTKSDKPYLVVANSIKSNEAEHLQNLPPRRTSYYTQDAQTQNIAFKPFIANIKPELKSEMQANADAGRAEKTNKTLVFGGITLATLLLGGGGFLLWKKRSKPSQAGGAQNIYPQYHY